MAVIDKQLTERFDEIPVSHEWAFSDARRVDTTYITHGYHRYPAKFIPQLARRLIEDHSIPGDTVLDPFCGCGTTLVESVVSRRHSFGYDINPISIMISMAKVRHLAPDILDEAYGQIQLDFWGVSSNFPSHERINYWFKEKQKVDLARLLQAILNISDTNVQRFFICGFSNILKNCSIWHQKSNKPTRDKNKKIPDVLKTFNRQVRMMMRGNSAFRELMNGEVFLANVGCKDSRNLPLVDESVDLVVTSPPYVTSYEYGDLHQLSMLWLENLGDLKAFRKQFIGSALRRVAECEKNQYQTLTKSTIAAEIGIELENRSGKTASSVISYFQSMYEIWAELYRLLRFGGKVCIVIGNTSLKGVEITNAEVFSEQMQNLGFELVNVIKREIPSKNLPSTRDKATGRFAKTSAADAMAYPTEFIMVLEKCR